MTLYEALQDINKGRFINTGCDCSMISLASGRYPITTQYCHKLGRAAVISITLTGKQGENARRIEREFYKFCEEHKLMYNCIYSIDYAKNYH